MSFFSHHFVLLIVLISFTIFFIICIGIINIVRRWQMERQLISRIRGRQSGPVAASILDDGSSQGMTGFSPLMSGFHFIGNLIQGRKTSPDRQPDNLRFLRAGLRWEKMSTVFLGMKFGLAAGFTLCFVMLKLSFLNIETRQMATLLTVVAALAGFYLPDLWIYHLTVKRKGLIQKRFPEALDLLVVCVESGMGMDGAFHRVAREIKFASPELSEELNTMNLELRAGKSRQEALKQLGLRIDLPEVSNFVTLMIQTDRFGTSVGDAMRTYSDSSRTERLQKAEEIAAKLSVKLLFPLIFCIFPALFTVIMGPAAIRIYQSFIFK